MSVFVGREIAVRSAATPSVERLQTEACRKADVLLVTDGLCRASSWSMIPSQHRRTGPCGARGTFVQTAWMMCRLTKI